MISSSRMERDRLGPHGAHGAPPIPCDKGTPQTRRSASASGMLEQRLDLAGDPLQGAQVRRHAGVAELRRQRPLAAGHPGQRPLGAADVVYAATMRAPSRTWSAVASSSAPASAIPSR